ncbi:MAG: hypothetical protein IPL77_11245 [Flavobacteriales bacterium]|nr:hypothetical protein [Flavobacteriales bacterium]
MAKHYIGIDPGKGPSSIVRSSSTTGLGIEVVIDDTKVKNKAEASTLLEHLEGRIDVKGYKA